MNNNRILLGIDCNGVLGWEGGTGAPLGSGGNLVRGLNNNDRGMGGLLLLKSRPWMRPENGGCFSQDGVGGGDSPLEKRQGGVGGLADRSIGKRYPSRFGNELSDNATGGCFVLVWIDESA